MKSDLKIVLLDINGEYDDNEENLDQEESKEKKETKLESPIRIINEFCSQNLFENLKLDKNELNQQVYSFNYPYQDTQDFACELYVIDDFSITYNVSLGADAYIVFCNLEKKTSYKQLEKMINYIKDSCSVDVKTYVLGIYEKRKLEEYDSNDMNLFLQDNQFLYEYYEIFDDTNEKKVENDNDKKNNNPGNIKDTLEKIFISIHEKKKNMTPVITKKNISKKNGDIDRSNVHNCVIF